MTQRIMTVGALTSPESEKSKLLAEVQQKIPDITNLEEGTSLCLVYTGLGNKEQVEALMAELLALRNPDGKLQTVINTAPISEEGIGAGTGKTEDSV